METNIEPHKDIFVLTLPLRVTQGQAAVLNKRFEICRNIYNNFQRKMKRMFAYVEQMRAWKECVKTKGDKVYPDVAARKKFMKDYTVVWKNTMGKNYNLHPFTEFGFLSYVASFSKIYQKNGINSSILRDIAHNAWAAWDKLLYGKGKKISFKKKDEFNSYTVGISSHGTFNGFDTSLFNGKHHIGINLNGGKGKNVKLMFLSFNVKTVYEKQCLENCNIREIGIKRVFVRGKWKYFISLTLMGVKPSKNRKLGTGRVGIDLGPSTIAVSSDDIVFIDELAKDVESIEKKKQRLLRKIDRSRRTMNPEQFNEDGTIRRFKKGERPAWKQSNRCKKKQNELKEVYRKQAVRRKESHIRLSNMLLSLGDDFVVENNPVSAWTRRAKETTTNKKGKINSKKRFGKSVANYAPSMFVTILENKVTSLGGNLTKIETKNAASQFDFTDQSFTKHELSERRITLSNGNTHLRDTVAAFNLQHLKGDKEYDTEAMEAQYGRFQHLEKEEIDRHLNSGRKLKFSFGIK